MDHPGKDGANLQAEGKDFLLVLTGRCRQQLEEGRKGREETWGYLKQNPDLRAMGVTG